jgi:hypothetical protein
MFRNIENPGDSAPRRRLSNAAVLFLLCVIAGFASAAPACRNFPASCLIQINDGTVSGF